MSGKKITTEDIPCGMSERTYNANAYVIFRVVQNNKKRSMVGVFTVDHVLDAMDKLIDRLEERISPNIYNNQFGYISARGLDRDGKIVEIFAEPVRFNETFCSFFA